MKAYVLVRFDPEADLSKAAHAMKEPGVESMDYVLGEWDAIVRVDAEDMAGLSKLSAEIRKCPGIRDSVTCPVAPVESMGG